MKTISNWKCIERLDLLEKISHSGNEDWQINVYSQIASEREKRKTSKPNSNNVIINNKKYGMCEVRSAPNNLASNDVAYLYSSIW